MNTRSSRWVILAVGLLLAAGRVAAIEVGDEAPKFVNPDVDGSYVFSRNLVGAGWLLIDFFATDCEACKKEMPELEDLLKNFGELGLRIVVFATDPDRSLVKPYFQQNPTAMTVLLDPYRVVAENYGVEEIPSLFLVDPEGHVAYKAVGYKEETAPELAQILAEALQDT